MSLTIEDFEQINTIVTNATKDLATKSELKSVAKGLATQDELQTAVKGLATKADLDRMESRLVASISLVERGTFDRLDEHEKRIVQLEKVVAR